MQSYTIKSFVDFVRYSDFFDLVTTQVIFRGQAVEGNLLPGIARKDPKKDTTTIEKKMLEDLKLIGAAQLPDRVETELDLLVRAQHFGLKTRLLDWTSNSLAALWFACADKEQGDAFVYALIVDDLMLPSTVYDDSPFRTAKTRAMQPRLNNARVFAQHGWFTLHRYSASSKAFVALEKNKDTKGALSEYRIPADKRQEILVALDRHGVSARTLYPDLTGICNYLSWRHGVV
jgi:hypothetical protein